MHRTNPDSLESCFCFRVFRLCFAFDFFNLLLVRFHRAGMIIVKHLIQVRNKEARVGVEPSTLRSWPSVNTTLLTTRPRCRICRYFFHVRQVTMR